VLNISLPHQYQTNQPNQAYHNISFTCSLASFLFTAFFKAIHTSVFLLAFLNQGTSFSNNLLVSIQTFCHHSLAANSFRLQDFVNSQSHNIFLASFTSKADGLSFFINLLIFDTNNSLPEVGSHFQSI
jgi:hypothetical protein